MRPILLLTAMAATMAMASTALAQSAQASPLADDQTPLPPMAEDRAQSDAMTIQLQALDTRIGEDEARMTLLRDGDLAKQNARIRAIKPALPFPAVRAQPH